MEKVSFGETDKYVKTSEIQHLTQNSTVFIADRCLVNMLIITALDCTKQFSTQ